MIYIFLGVVITLLIFEIFISNRSLQISKYKIEDEKLPKEFDGFRITHISDYHDGIKGRGNLYIREKILESNPDALLITGDIIDSRRTNLDNTINLLNNIKDIAPIYFSMGNHESRINERVDLENYMVSCGIHVLRNRNMWISIDSSHINIIGIDDPDFYFLKKNKEIRGEYSLSEASSLLEKDEFNILMHHRPEYFEQISKSNVDLILTGHAHGGQWRIFNIALYAPGQGFLPKYTKGKHKLNNSTMIVNRGIGNSKFPFRLFNVPEIVSIELVKC